MLQTLDVGGLVAEDVAGGGDELQRRRELLAGELQLDGGLGVVQGVDSGQRAQHRRQVGTPHRQLQVIQVFVNALLLDS